MNFNDFPPLHKQRRHTCLCSLELLSELEIIKKEIKDLKKCIDLFAQEKQRIFDEGQNDKTRDWETDLFFFT